MGILKGVLIEGQKIRNYGKIPVKQGVIKNQMN
jgi:hypothetical protein